METKTKEKTWYCQEKIGGWRQNAVFEGTLEECEKYVEGCNGSFAIVPEQDYEVDYL